MEAPSRLQLHHLLPYVLRSGVRSSVPNYASASATRRTHQKRRPEKQSRGGNEIDLQDSRSSPTLQVHDGNDREVRTPAQRECCEWGICPRWGFAHVGRPNSWNCEMHARCPFDGKRNELQEFTGPVLYASHLHKASSVPARDHSRMLGCSGGKCLKAVNVAPSSRIGPAGQLVVPHPLGKQQVLQEGRVRVEVANRQCKKGWARPMAENLSSPLAPVRPYVQDAFARSPLEHPARTPVSQRETNQIGDSEVVRRGADGR